MIVQDIRIFILHVIDLHLFEYKCYKRGIKINIFLIYLLQQILQLSS